MATEVMNGVVLNTQINTHTHGCLKLKTGSPGTKYNSFITRCDFHFIEDYKCIIQGRPSHKCVSCNFIITEQTKIYIV